GMDMMAGPSEILVISDGSAPAEWVAMDLFSQAEHDEDAQALLLSPDGAHLDAVEAAIGPLLREMPRKRVIAASLKARGALVLTRDLDEACALASRIAPEHLELLVETPGRLLPKLGNAGAIFLGRWSSEAIGDYAAGMVKLDAMENPYPLPAALQRQLAERLASVALNRYPEPNPRALRELIMRKMRVPAGMALLLGNGSDDLIQILTLALARPGAALMYPSPTFVMYGMNAAISRMRAVPVPLREDFSFDADAFVARMRE